jgi:molecular chaperone GrpE
MTHPRKPTHTSPGSEPPKGPAGRSESATATSEATRLQERTADLEASLAEARDRHLRLAADFDNFKKRARQDQLDIIQHASAELISRLLPGLDDLHQALAHRPLGIDEAWVKGLELSVKKLEEALKAHGLEPIDAVGTRFDPKVHEAIGHEESVEQPEDTVLSELRRGYRIRDRVIRPALVRLARPPEPAAGDDSTGG